MITPIPTWYAGRYFRSRLEARWAVAFDHLNLIWEYEPQGYTLSQRLTLGDEEINYLPDFWLPGFEVFGEVKGSLNDTESERLLNIAASLSSADGAGCHDNGGHDLAVFGPIPSDRDVKPIRLHMHKGCLLASPLLTPGHRLYQSPCRGLHLACDLGGSGILEQCEIIPHGHSYHPSGEYVANLVEVGQFLLEGMVHEPPSPTGWADGYAAAHSARFEFGQYGAST